MPDKDKGQLPKLIPLKFRSVLLTDKDEKQIYAKKQEGFEEDGKTPHIVDDEDTKLFDLKDIEVLIELIKLVDIGKLRLDEERRHCMILEKLRERWKAEDWDCEIEFSEAEARFLKDYLNDVKEKANEKAVFTPYHSRTKFSLIDQLSERI